MADPVDTAVQWEVTVGDLVHGAVAEHMAVVNIIIHNISSVNEEKI